MFNVITPLSSFPAALPFAVSPADTSVANLSLATAALATEPVYFFQSNGY